MNPVLINPSLCLSSRLTSCLLEFRNPQGAEENWLYQREHVDNYFINAGKVISTEIGCSLLCLVASVESIAYGILFLGSLPLMFFTDLPAKSIRHLLSSSTFTIWWNLGNVAVFNLYCTNVATQESFARFTIENRSYGKFFKLILGITSLTISIFALIAGVHIDSPLFLVPKNFFRNIDKSYIQIWLQNHPIVLYNLFFNRPTISLDEMYMSLTALLNIINMQGLEVQQINNSVDEGVTFFKETILNQVDPATKAQILEMSPEAIIFTLSHAVYTYVLGPRKGMPIPRFFQDKTKKSIEELRYAIGPNKNSPIPQSLNRESIQRLRSQFNHISNQNLEQLNLAFKTIAQFTELFEDNSDEKRIIRNLLNSLKNVAYKESQGESLFLRVCWGKACEIQ